MRIAIFGAGGLGGYYGLRLLEAGQEVVFVARGAHKEAIENDGFKLLSPLGDLHVRDVQVTDDPATIGPQDAVLVAVKTWQIPTVAESIGTMLHPETIVVPFLNGVEAPRQLDALLGGGHAAAGLSKIFSLIEAPGVIRHINDAAYVAIGELDGRRSERIVALGDAFRDAGVEVELPADMTQALWEKLITVTSWSGMGALARSPIGVMRADPELRQLIDRAMDETIAVAAAEGVTIGSEFKTTLWSFYDALPDGATASLMRDIMEGRPSELDAWSEIGRAHV